MVKSQGKSRPGEGGQFKTSPLGLLGLPEHENFSCFHLCEMFSMTTFSCGSA